MGRGSGVRASAATSIQISFEYKGVQCRERISVPPTPANIRAWENKKAIIKNEIALGTFDYYKHFPNSKRAGKFARNPAQTVLVGQVLTEWLASTVKKIQPETYSDYAEYVAHVWRPAFGSLRLSELTHERVMQWVDDQDKSKKRILNLLTPLRQAVRYAVGRYLDTDPLGKLTIKRARELKKRVIDPFSTREIELALQHLEPQVANMCQFWAWTGLRMGELIALTWEDIDETRGVAMVTKAARGVRVKVTKTEAGYREVKLLPGALDALLRQKLYTRMVHAQVFLNPKGRSMWTHDKQIRVHWQEALRLAGVRYRFPRQLRHTYASWMLGAGESPMWVSNQMGHEDVSVTLKHYARFVPADNPNAGMKAATLYADAKLLTVAPLRSKSKAETV